MGQNPAQGLGDLARGQRSGGDLVQQRLEEMEVPPVHQRHLDIGLAEVPHCLQACEATADDDHPVRRASPVRGRAAWPGPSGLRPLSSGPVSLVLFLSQWRVTLAGQFRLPLPRGLLDPGC